MKHTLPPGFVILSKVAPKLLIDLRYCTDDNLIGRPLEGYAPDGVAVLTDSAALSLHHISEVLHERALQANLSWVHPQLLIFEAYRPQRASDDFFAWSQSSCEKTKQNYYPNIDKKDFFKLGYIARQSSHTRGSAVDLTILSEGKPIDMGTTFDFMDPLSHPDNPNVSDEAYQNRQFLKTLMNDFGWQGINEEWWHFSFSQETFPDTYFDFPVLNYMD